MLFATPIWWGGRSSLMQRVIERMDAFDEGTVPGGRDILLGKVAGIVLLLVAKTARRQCSQD